MPNKIAVIDCQVAGISGDMLLAALVDAGADADKVIRATKIAEQFLPESKITEVKFVKTRKLGISATKMQLSYRDNVNLRSGSYIYRSLVMACKSLGLGKRATKFALGSLKSIIDAEARVHGEDPSQVHLHEASSIDTFVDILGCAVALEDLGLYDCIIYSTRVAVGGGLLDFSHGIVSNPAPAILELFKGKPFTLFGGHVSDEVTTPTGAAMLINLAIRSIDHYPALNLMAVGYGSGEKNFKKIPNVLKLSIGLQPESEFSDKVCVIESNVDDISGEIIGNIIEKMSKVAGVKDIAVISAITKKNRPASIIKIIADPARAEAIIEILHEESGTLGIRYFEAIRSVRSRKVIKFPVTILNKSITVRVKVATNIDGKIISTKPEYEDVRQASRSFKMPLKIMMEIINAQVAQKLNRK